MDADTGHLCRGRIWLVMKQLGDFNSRLMLSKGKKALPAIPASIRVNIATDGLAIIRVKLNRATEKKMNEENNGKRMGRKNNEKKGK